MEGNNCSDLNSSNSKSQEELSNNGNISKKISNKIYFNSITGEQINKDDGDEADLKLFQIWSKMLKIILLNILI